MGNRKDGGRHRRIHVGGQLKYFNLIRGEGLGQ